MTDSPTRLRSDRRIPVPEGYVREIALWFCDPKERLRLHVEELGRPDLRLTRLGSGRMELSDITVRGMGLTLSLPPHVTQKILSATNMHAYLQLWDPTADDPCGVLSVFATCQLAAVEPLAQGLFLGARFLRFAVASNHDKCLDFLDATRCGINELTHWCDNIDRGVSFEARLPAGGLDMDNLLAEVEHTLNGAAVQPDAPSFSSEEK